MKQTRTLPYFHGRRIGKGYTEKKKRFIRHHLERYKFDSTEEIHVRVSDSISVSPQEDLWIEIGFGTGEHLVHMAEMYPHISFVGCDAYVNGIAQLLMQIEERGITNIKIWPSDAYLLLKRLPEDSIGRIDIPYPDPWPKRRQAKKRLMNREAVSEIARVLRVGGILNVVTDSDCYAGTTLKQIFDDGRLTWRSEAPEDYRIPYVDWCATRFERKALASGRQPIYLQFVC